MVGGWLHVPSRRIVLSTLVVGIAIGLFACGEGPVEPTPEPIGIEFDKQAVTIEGVTEGRDVTQTFLLVNRGEQASIVRAVKVLDSSECDEVKVPESSFFIAPGDSVVISVLMKGHKATELPHTVKLGVQTRSGGVAQTNLDITFQGITDAPTAHSGPRLGIDHESVDIGIIPYDWPMHERFVLVNYGDQPLRFNGTPLIRVLEGC